LAANATGVTASVDGALPGVVDSQPQLLEEDKELEHSAEHIRSQLLSLSLRQADVQKRIQQVRHALVALVSVFGPEILATAGVRRESTHHNVSRSRTKVIDILRVIFGRSTQWVTFNQLLEAVQKESPSTLAGFINPGVSLSNALRTLERHGEIESFADARPAKWRSTSSGHLMETSSMEI